MEAKCHFQSSPMSITCSSASPSTSSIFSTTESSSSASSFTNICMNVKRRTSEPVISRYDNNAEAFLDASGMSDDLNISSSNPNNHHHNQHNNSSVNEAKPSNRFFPDGVLDILNKWFYENQNYPYPDENMTNILANDANISAKQVRKWFANKRVRSNKCYKQTFRSKKDLAMARSASRRQTKSVSDADALASSNGDKGDYFENEELNNHVYPLQTSSSSSSSSSPLSNRFSSSSPINSKPTLHHSFDLGTQHTHFYQNDDKNMHFQESSSLLCNNLNNNNGSLAYLYNPYLFMNFLQNPSIAFHAVMANRFLTMQNVQPQSVEYAMNSTPSLNTSIDYSAASSVSSSSSSSFNGCKAIQKRKTHLSNRFLNESALNESTSGLQIDTQASQAFETSKPVRKHKINFGDISDLIN